MDSSIQEDNIEIMEILVPEILKNGKDYTSFSDIKDCIECPFRYKLKHIDKIEIDDKTEHTFFGGALHEACEDYLKTRIMKYEIALDKIVIEWTLRQYKDMGNWMLQSNAILKEVPKWFDIRFPGWEFISSEERFKETISDKTDILLKGFIDGVIFHDGYYYIFDWKTSTKGWNDYKKEKDKTTRLQLLLYTIAWSKKFNIPFNKIKLGFVILIRDLTMPQRIDFFEFEFSDKDINYAIETFNKTIKIIQGKYQFKIWKYEEPKFMKGCRFCKYNGTKHCP